MWLRMNKKSETFRYVIPGLPALCRFGKGRLDPESRGVRTQWDRGSKAAMTD
ncbi:MAG: hypothetical protein MUF39_03000 [Cyclobacteriaceae bacterium]|nr:hypothetical protein [Cyclobacteriaceae bacterium]